MQAKHTSNTLQYAKHCNAHSLSWELKEGNLETHELQRVAFGVSLNLNLQSQFHWSLIYETWQKRPRVLDLRLRFETEETKLQMQ